MSARSSSPVVGPVHVLLYALAFLFTIATGALAQCVPGGCGPGMVCIDCGRGSQCAVSPATCCAGTICGDGMICVQTSQGPQCGIRGGGAPPGGAMRPRPVAPPPTAGICLPGGCPAGMTCIDCGRGAQCAVIPATCCAGVICGAGLICVQTSQGPQCGLPPAQSTPGRGGATPPQTPQPPTIPRTGGDPLGAAWDETELGWRGTWTRRGGSNVFDAQWVHPNGARDAAELTFTVNGRQVVILRRQSKGECRYQGTLSADGARAQGTYGCSWAPGPWQWSATIRDAAGRQPAGGPQSACPPGTVDLLGICSGGVQPLR